MMLETLKTPHAISGTSIHHPCSSPLSFDYCRLLLQILEARENSNDHKETCRMRGLPCKHENLVSFRGVTSIAARSSYPNPCSVSPIRS